MKYLIFWITLLVCFQAHGQDHDPVGFFPKALIDAACTDDFDTPAASTPWFPRSSYVPQSSGSSDGLCDGDTKVLTGTLDADTDLGPIGSVNYQNGYLYIDADTVSGGTPTWRICVKILRPWTRSQWTVTIGCSESISGTITDGYIGLGPMFVTTTDDDAAAPMVQPLPKEFIVTLDLVGATDWAGSIGFVPVRGGGK